MHGACCHDVLDGTVNQLVSWILTFKRVGGVPAPIHSPDPPPRTATEGNHV